MPTATRKKSRTAFRAVIPRSRGGRSERARREERACALVGKLRGIRSDEPYRAMKMMRAQVRDRLFSPFSLIVCFRYLVHILYSVLTDQPHVCAQF